MLTNFSDPLPRDDKRTTGFPYARTEPGTAVRGQTSTNRPLPPPPAAAAARGHRGLQARGRRPGPPAAAAAAAGLGDGAISRSDGAARREAGTRTQPPPGSSRTTPSHATRFLILRLISLLSSSSSAHRLGELLVCFHSSVFSHRCGYFLTTVQPSARLLTKTASSEAPKRAVTLAQRAGFSFPVQPEVKVTAVFLKGQRKHLHTQTDFENEHTHNSTYFCPIDSSHLDSPSQDFCKARKNTNQRSFRTFCPTCIHAPRDLNCSCGCPGIKAPYSKNDQ